MKPRSHWKNIDYQISDMGLLVLRDDLIESMNYINELRRNLKLTKAEKFELKYLTESLTHFWEVLSHTISPKRGVFTEDFELPYKGDYLRIYEIIKGK